MKKLVLGGFVLSACGLVAGAQMKSPPSSSPAAPQAGSCPIRVDEAFLTMAPVGKPGDPPNDGLVLHVSLADISEKPVKAFTVHASVALRPDPTLRPGSHVGSVTRKWSGDLEPNTAHKEQWSIPGGRFSTRLNRIWFDNVMFADGTNWTKSNSDGCSFGPTGRVVQAHTPTVP